MEHKERTRTSISPLGLNKSTPDNVVEDGALEVCHNLRFANGAWRNVQEFSAKDIPDALKNKKIEYIHPVGGEHNFITKQETEVRETRVKFYGMRSQPTNNEIVQPKGSGDTTPSPTFDSGDIDMSKFPMVGILDSFYTNYYLDAPLSIARKNPSSVTLYDKDLVKMGVVDSFDKGVLSYIPEQDGRGVFILYSADVAYLKLGETLNETFYFVSDTPSTEYGHNAVFIKRGDNYYYYGGIILVENDTYAIREKATGIVISCNISSLNMVRDMFKKGIFNGEEAIYFNVYEENAIFYSDDFSSLGYLSDTSAETESSTTPKFSINENGIIKYYCWGIDDDEVEFEREITASKTETDEEYLARYYQLSEELQILGNQKKVCLNFVQNGGGQCWSFYTWEIVDNHAFPSIPFFHAVPANNITEEIVVGTRSSLTAWDKDGAELGNFANLSGGITIDHFGNMLIVRDFETSNTHYYLFSEGVYQPYGNMGTTQLSFSVSVKDSIKSPRLRDVPMFYKAPGYASADGSLDGRLFVGAGEPILSLAPLRYDTLNPAGNILLPNSELNGYFRGELALFVVARSEDGTEICRSAPQAFRSETLLDADANVFLFNPISDAIYKEYPQAYDPEYLTNTYLIWDRMLWDEGVGITKDTPPAYEKWDKRASRKRSQEILKPFLEGVTASDFYKLEMNISAEGNNIHEIAIYSTRLYPLFVFENNAIKTNPVDVLNEPFYEMKVLSDGERSFTITYNDLNNIEAKTDAVYKPMQSAEDTFFSAKGIEYNNAYHAYDIEVLTPPMASSTMVGVHEDTLADMVTSRLYNNSTVYASYAAQNVFSQDVRKYKGFAPTQDYFISFREQIKEVLFGKMSADRKYINALGRFLPEYSTSLNCSYIVNKNKDVYDSDDAGLMFPNVKWDSSTYQTFVRKMQDCSRSFRKYKPVSLLNLEVAEDRVCIPAYPIEVPNRVQVSETGNPLTNPYNLSYRIGTTNNEIITMNSVAVKLSDAKFGEFPLYVFTKEGIYAMQTGTETAYSNIIPIAKDVAINPNTLATSGAVFFFTEKGLHSISKDGVNLISAGLHEDSNRIPDWMYTCKLVHLPEYNEIMCVLMDNNVTTGKAYIFSIDNQCWSEREVPQGQVFNDHEVVDLNIISDLESEGDVVKKDIVMETRPIKLGANKELKRLETLVVRFEADKDEELEITIKGSIDGVEYKDLRKVSATTNTDVLIRRTPASVKYLKFVVKSSNLQSSIRLIRFDTEHYLRFVRKIR